MKSRTGERFVTEKDTKGQGTKALGGFGIKAIRLQGDKAISSLRTTNHPLRNASLNQRKSFSLSPCGRG